MPTAAPTTTTPSRTVRLVALALALAAASSLALSVEGGAVRTIAFLASRSARTAPATAWAAPSSAASSGSAATAVKARLGTTAWGTALVAMAALVMLAAAVAAKRMPRVLGLATLSATLTTAVAGALFFTGLPASPARTSTAASGCSRSACSSAQLRRRYGE